MIYVNIALILINLYLIFKPRPKVRFFKEGIQILNKKGQVTIEYDKPLKK